MSAKIINLRDIRVVQTTNLVGSEYNITVTGEAFVPTTNTKAHFEETRPQGINPTILLLDLVEKADGIGGQAFIWTKIEMFKKRVSEKQYRQVEIFFKGEKAETVEVEEVLS